MACTSGPDVLQASDGKTRFVRLARLLMCGGTTVMRELFDYVIPPANLATVLSSHVVKTRLTDMKNKRILTSPQWDKLYPPFGSVQSTSFDITLLFKLLREKKISGLSAPSTGWDKLPNISDTSLPADMARIKYYRNELAHGDEKMELSEQEFGDYWKEIKDALVRIVGHYATSGSSTVKDWETAVDTLLSSPLTEDDRKWVEDLTAEELRWYYLESRLRTSLGPDRKEKPKCEAFQRARSVLENIIKSLKEWLPIRKKSITLVRETADKLDDLQNNVNIATFCGAGTGITGVALLGAGGLATFFTMGAAAPLIGVGVAASVGGAVVSGAADITWFVRNKRYLNEVEDVLTKDHAIQEKFRQEVRNFNGLIKKISEEENITEEEALENVVIALLKDYKDIDRDRLIVYLYSVTGCQLVLSGAAQITLGAVAVGSFLAAGAARKVLTTLPPILLAAINIYQLQTTSKSIERGSKSEAARELRDKANELDEELHKHKDLLIDIVI